MRKDSCFAVGFKALRIEETMTLEWLHGCVCLCRGAPGRTYVVARERVRGQGEGGFIQRRRGIHSKQKQWTRSTLAGGVSL